MLAALTLLGAGSATLHNHPGASVAEQPGLAAHVAVSVVADPDPWSAAFHFHSGSTAPSEPCAACVLCNARGEVMDAVAPTPAAPCIHIVVDAAPAPAAPAVVRADSRSPPTAA